MVVGLVDIDLNIEDQGDGDGYSSNDGLIDDGDSGSWGYEKEEEESYDSL